MANSNLNMDKTAELKKIRDEYAFAVREAERRRIPVHRLLNESRLRSMQSTLHSILLTAEHAKTAEELERANEAAVLFNAISSVIKSFQFERRIAV